MTVRIGLAIAATAIVLAAGPAQAQREPACVKANDDVTRYRLGKDRAGKPNAVDLPRAVAIGDAAARRCRADDGFSLAYALARIDLSGDPKHAAPAQRAQLFNAGIADLERIRTNVLAGRSDRYEIFNVLGLIYYQTNQFDKAAVVLTPPPATSAKMTPESRQKTLVTLGMAQAHLGQRAQAASAFDLAAKSGAPRASEIKRQMLGPSR